LCSWACWFIVHSISRPSIRSNLIIENPEIEDEDEQEREDEDDWGRKIANPLRRAELVRVACLAFIVSFATSPGSVKGTFNLFSVTGDLAGFAPA
jgi:hypothetical protein